METKIIHLRDFLATAFEKGAYNTDDVIALVLPLFREVLELHESGLVASFEKEPILYHAEDHVLGIDKALAEAPSYALDKVQELFPRQFSKAFEVVGEGPADPLRQPAWLPGYSCFEMVVGHHDPQTDLFCLGLVLGSLSLGLDLYDEAGLAQFIRIRANPLLYPPRIHPSLSRLIREMTELDRAHRSQDLYNIIHRLLFYRDHDPEKQTDLSQIAGWMSKDLKDKGPFILNKLRNRLFDTSRRNRLLYYKPNMRFVNLTVSSVPDVLHYQSIRPELLFTWNEEVAEKVTGMREIILNRYLRFEDHGYLPASLDRLRVDSRRAIQEYGFSQLKLVIGFLNWHNLKDEPDERIQTPLLLIPVELRKIKKVREDHYILKILDNAAEVNPVLAGQLKDLYGIRLPEFVDLEEMSPEKFYQVVKVQVEAANQGITLEYTDKPRLRLIHTEATQTVTRYRNRQRRQAGAVEQEPLQAPGPSETTAVTPDLQQTAEGPGAEGLATATPVTDLPAEGLAGAGRIGLAGSDFNAYRWDLDVCHMVLGNFNYKKMSLVQDYTQVIDQQLQHTVFDALFSDQPRILREQTFDLNNPGDWFHVIAADPSQTSAILQSRAGYSYIIQGPPGTGKSQTITNLIADFVARGKTVLFVCEKRAALDVVFHRLKQNGLAELCCYIHDSQGDKRDFIKDLRSTYEDLTTNKTDLTGIKTQRTDLVNRMKAQVELIKEYHLTNLSGEKEIGMEVRELIARIIGLRPWLVNLQPAEEELLPSYREWMESGPAVNALTTALEELGTTPVFAAHPFSRVNEQVFASDQPHRLLDRLSQEALTLLDKIERVLGEQAIPQKDLQREELKTLVQYAVLLYPLALTDNLQLADPASPGAREMEEEKQRYRRQQENFRRLQQKNIHWTQKLSEQDLENAQSLAAKNEGAVLSFLNGSWKKLKTQLAECYDFSSHAVRPAYTLILQNLRDEYEAGRELENSLQHLQQTWRLENIETAWLSIGLLQGKQDDPTPGFLLQRPDAVTLISALQGLHQPLNDLESRLKNCLNDPEESSQSSLPALRDLLQNIQLNTDSLQELLPALRIFMKSGPAVKQSLRHFNLIPLQIEAALAHKELKQVYQSNKRFAGLDHQTLEKVVIQLGDCYADLQRLNADLIRAFVRFRFLQQAELAGRPAGQLDEEQKKLKKCYNEGRKILENEFGKSIRYKSIRELSSRESGRILKDIKPVWLMSPYSVSDSLPLDSHHFDVVIFDEASQITLEEGVPALYRSQQTIIVGDERQMPPTDFFSSKAEDPEDLETMEDDPEEWLSDDVDSLLAQGERKLESTLLNWHYRSHYETLISFSNHAFYEGNLLTIPDKTIHHGEKEAIRVLAPDDALRFADCLFDRSISFHFHPGSVYEKRSNRSEATYIAFLVRALLNRDARQNIGIVAFSQEQQHAIENALDDLSGQDPAFGQKLEDAYTRTENDQFTGLIVKNLENIQGDERDIIIMSVCYGPDARKKMIMNFGPINKKGGEKRLNVLFSRARTHMAVISSIRFDDITNDYNEGANYLKRFLQYAEMVSMGRMDAARNVLLGLSPSLPQERRSQTEDPAIIVRQIKEQVQTMGYEVAEEVGQSDFKCSLAIKGKAASDGYILGILLDDNRFYRNRNLVEQYYQRPAILEKVGWKVLSVFAKDWLHQPQRVMEEIRSALSEESSPRNIAADQPAGLTGASTRPGGAYDHLNFECFQLRDGQTEKFWEAARDGNRLVIRWGKTGTKGQIQLKTLPDEETAEKEMERQISEIKGKGYSGSPL